MIANALIQDSDSASQTIEETFALVDEVVAYTKVYDCGKLSDITRLEFFQFIAYLAASDDTVRKEETDFINSCFGTDWTPQGLAAYLMENGIHNQGFDKMIPLSLEILVQADNILSRDGLLHRETLSETIICLYQLLGNLFIKSSSHPSNWEHHDLDVYIEHLNNYVSQNFKKTPNLKIVKKTAIISENTESINGDSEDIGIAAPNKEDDLGAVAIQEETDLLITTVNKDEDSGIIAPTKS